MNFVALDFETANRYRNSACAVAAVRVEDGHVVDQFHQLIQPPFRYFEFTYIHGIDWPAVRRARTFRLIWPRLWNLLNGVDFVAAHNAPFDRSVLRACCDWYGIQMPRTPFRCTVRIARATWGLRPTTLRHVADFLGLDLDHHNAASDARACADIVLHAEG